MGALSLVSGPLARRLVLFFSLPLFSHCPSDGVGDGGKDVPACLRCSTFHVIFYTYYYY